MDNTTTTTLMKSCLDFIMADRDNRFEDAITAAKEMRGNLGVEPVLKETHIHWKKRQFGYESRDEVMGSSEETFKRQIFCLLVDTARVSSEERFGQMKHHKKTCWVLYDLCEMPGDREKTLEQLYGPSLDADTWGMFGCQ
ncbi:hypothetical protein KIL84_013775 [Mauremys mutica]|uniref:Uncharacterized protein n=1 Tax=Mauremys mutica TaxID=74926 RepID=A0A9D4AUN6_9SAUR|nr:hypothetical protein KIL84_013775 [Mauremys mutica]